MERQWETPLKIPRLNAVLSENMVLALPTGEKDLGFEFMEKVQTQICGKAPPRGARPPWAAELHPISLPRTPPHFSSVRALPPPHKQDRNTRSL